MAKFHKLKIKEITQETADCVSIAFDIPADLKSEYQYIQGQYITFKLNVKGEEIRRSYSLCSSPLTEAELRVAVKKVKNGRASVWLNENIKGGTELEVMTPMGTFHSPLNASNKKNYVLIAGGSGITPMLSIIKTVLHAEPQSAVALFYGNRDEASIIFKDQIEKIAAENKGRFTFFDILENPAKQVDAIFKGMMTQDKLKEIFSKYVDLKADNEFFICGPTPMMDNARITLENLSVEKKRIHIEYFTAAPTPAKTETVASTENITSNITVILDGSETKFQLNTKGKSILDSALDAGVDVPFACKGGVCCTCRAKVLEGKVKMDNNYALTDTEVEQDYVLTCQSHPLTPVVVVDYDQI